MSYRSEQSEEYHKNYRKQYRKLIRQKNKEYRKRNPWLTAYNNAKQRCENPNHPDYKYYGFKGVKFLLTVSEIKNIWFKDKAYKLSDPTIDRKDNDGNYEYFNCQYIENKINSQKDKIYPRLFQYSLEKKFIKEWKSQAEVFRFLKIQQSDISKCIHGIISSAGGFIWKQIKV